MQTHLNRIKTIRSLMFLAPPRLEDSVSYLHGHERSLSESLKVKDLRRHVGLQSKACTRVLAQFSKLCHASHGVSACYGNPKPASARGPPNGAHEACVPKDGEGLHGTWNSVATPGTRKLSAVQLTSVNSSQKQTLQSLCAPLQAPAAHIWLHIRRSLPQNSMLTYFNGNFNLFPPKRLDSCLDLDRTASCEKPNTATLTP